MNKNRKVDFPVSQVRRYLEPGPIVLISSHHAGKNNIMTLGWHCILEFSPSLVGCMISAGNHSFDIILSSEECVINLPTISLMDTVIDIGNCHGDDVDKFDQFGLTPVKATKVNAPLIAETHASFECKLYDQSLVKTLNFFVFQVVKAHVVSIPEQPETMHYQGDGKFMISGKVVDKKSRFKYAL